MPHDWNAITLSSEEEVLQTLLELQGKAWWSRGQPKDYGRLEPTIDRPPRRGLSRPEMLELERRGLERFRSTARFFSSQGEGGALVNDVIALMVLRHYGVPTRLLDWSASPYVATNFAVDSNDNQDGEIWSFSQVDYAREGQQQWKRHPETTVDGSGDPEKFAPGLTAFRLAEPPDWIVAQLYHQGFPRQNAQHALYTMTARFGIDHADALRALLQNESRHQRYLIKANLKPSLRETLRSRFGIWQGTLFPDTAAAAEFAGEVFR